jgi:protein-S-isoprenylcysteine O-methyltransferase Ste14
MRFVVHGVYCHVRNPMISGVILVLLAESLLTASQPLFCWFLVFAVVNATYIPLSEEPGLLKRFGEAYVTYRRIVPRWIPRLTSCDGGAGDAS